MKSKSFKICLRWAEIRGPLIPPGGLQAQIVLKLEASPRPLTKSKEVKHVWRAFSSPQHCRWGSCRVSTALSRASWRPLFSPCLARAADSAARAKQRRRSRGPSSKEPCQMPQKMLLRLVLPTTICSERLSQALARQGGRRPPRRAWQANLRSRPHAPPGVAPLLLAGLAALAATIVEACRRRFARQPSRARQHLPRACPCAALCMLCALHAAASLQHHSLFATPEERAACLLLWSGARRLYTRRKELAQALQGG